MNTSLRRWAAGVIIAGTAAMIPAGMAWACVGLVSLTASPTLVQPGGNVTLVGKEFAPGVPVDIHLDSLTGAVIATVPPATVGGMNTQFTANVVLPVNISQGQHVLIATQQEHYMNGGSPARATITVGSATAVAAPGARPIGIITSSGPSAGSLVLLGLAVAGAGLFVGGVATAATSHRRRPQTEGVPG